MRNRNNQRNPLSGQTTAVTVLEQAAVELYYDYSKVDEAHRETVRRAAITIKPRLKRSAEDLFVIGKELQSTKALLPHGEYTNWLGAEFGLSERMAQRFVSVYERLGFKSDIMSVLPPTTLYLLSAPSTPDAAIEQVEQQLDAHKPLSVAFVQKVINESKRTIRIESADGLDEHLMAGVVLGQTASEEKKPKRRERTQRLATVLSTVISLLGGQADEDWLALCHNDALKRVREEVVRLKGELLGSLAVEQGEG